MPDPFAHLERTLAELRTAMVPFAHVSPAARVKADLAAASFHLCRTPDDKLTLAIIGGTGTGKSTLANRLLGIDVTAASFRRTFTAGPVAILGHSASLPNQWLGLAHQEVESSKLPARGSHNAVSIVRSETALLDRLSLIDTPDLDGDQSAHHALADLVFRWCDAALFLVTPEKYQMTELLPYYRLARRYALPTVFVMNKAEEQAVIDDFHKQLMSRGDIDASTSVYAIERDGATFEVSTSQNLVAMQSALLELKPLADELRRTGVCARVADVLDRCRDQVIVPAKQARSEVDRIIDSIRAMNAPASDVDVNPLLVQLRRRMQQRSILYLMGPGRVFDRVRQVPGLIARLPRSTWDLFRHGKLSRNGSPELPDELSRTSLDFRQTLTDQFVVVQSRIDDVLRSSPSLAAKMDDLASGFAEVKLSADEAGQIADDEIAKLKDWLGTRWNATPRDTAAIDRLMKFVPGGKQLTQLSETAPYLLAAVVAAHHAFFGPVDLVVLGGFGVATWMIEKLSNEVSSRAKQSNRAINQRFADLGQKQIERTCAWLNRQAATAAQLHQLNKLADQASEVLESADRS